MYNVAILTASDRGFSGEREDLSGLAIHQLLASSGSNFQVVAEAIVPDEIDEIIEVLNSWCADKIPLILTTGGTGFSPRDITPDATLKVIAVSYTHLTLPTKRIV